MSSPLPEAVATLHAIVEGRTDAAALVPWIDDDAVFHSPVMHTPQHGKALVMQYLGAALQLFRQHSFTYRRNIIDGQNAVLEFDVVVDGVEVNGVDILTLDFEGKIIEFKVMMRPLTGIQKIREAMIAQLEAARCG